MAARSRTLVTVRRLAIWGTALLGLGVVVGGVRLGTDGYERWTPEREVTQPLADIVAGFVEGPRPVAGPVPVVPVATPGEEAAAPSATESSVSSPPAGLASTALPTRTAGAAPSPMIDLARSELVSAPTIDPPDATSTPSDLPGSARSHERAPWSSRRANPFDGLGLPSPAKVPPELGVEKIDERADAISMEGARDND